MEGKAHNEVRQATQAGSIMRHPDIWTLKTAMYQHERTKLQALGQPTNRIERYKLARHIDQALPGKHTRNIYDTLNKRDANILSYAIPAHSLYLLLSYYLCFFYSVVYR
jgi:hypothetical protein